MTFNGCHLELDIIGASHAPDIKFCLSGLPDGFTVDEKRLAAFMERRAPGRDRLSTSRKESDNIHFDLPWSGYILNENARPQDYAGRSGQEAAAPVIGALSTGDAASSPLRTVPRPGHADYPQYVRYGRIPTGGGSNSGRMTAAYCAAGGMCLQYLESRGISISAKIAECGDIEKAKKEGDSVGGIIECEVRGVPPGFGGAMFDGLDGAIARAVFGIPGVKGIEFGNGFAACGLKGSQNNDAFVIKNGEVRTRTNNHGGILGGFSSGMPIVFRVAMKPTPTIFKEQESVDLKTLKPAKLAMKGRHDPCIVRRAVPVVEATAALAIADVILNYEFRLPRICLTLTGKTIAEDLAQYRSQKLFTDMVELRVDLLDKKELASAAKFPKLLAKAAGRPVPMILTIRRKRDGGAWTGSEKSRAALFKKLLKNFTRPFSHSHSSLPFSLYVDFESDFHCCDKFTCGAKVVRSIHCFDGTIPEVEVGDGEILKLAVKGKGLTTSLKLFESFSDLPLRSPSALARPAPAGHVVMQMGYEGFFTRALAARLGSKWVYTSVGGLHELGHVTPEELVRDFRFRDVDATGIGAELFGVTGWPLRKTRSPELHNAAFFNAGAMALMVPMPCSDIRKVLKAADALYMRGLAVTIPHKETIIPLLDKIDPVAKAVGAVNTVLFDGGRLYGYNTDVAGFTRALMEFAGSYLPREGARATNLPREGARATNLPREGARATSLKGAKVALLGNGGAAKACKYALKKLGCKVTVFHRKPLTDGFNIIVNATPVDPIPEYKFRGDELVFDLRYVPEVTDLMSRAAKAGCRVCNGFNMLRYQAEEQRRIWGWEGEGGR